MRQQTGSWRGPTAVLGAGAFVVGWLAPEVAPSSRLAEWAPLVMVLGAVLTLAALVAAFNHATGSSGRIGWWSWRSRRNRGVASPWTMWRVASRRAMRRQARVVRPSLAELPFWRRWFVGTRECGTRLVRVGRQWVWSSVESVTLRFGGPRVGKTAELVCRIMDAPGAVIATSTRYDIVELTSTPRAANRRHAAGVRRLAVTAWVCAACMIAALFGVLWTDAWWQFAAAAVLATGGSVGLLRIDAARPARPVGVFNPSGLGGVASTVHFDPLSGCGDPRTAMDRAADLLSATAAPGRGGESEFWAHQARTKLTALLHAAALGGGSMRDVLAWVAAPELAAAEIQQALRRSSEPALAEEAVSFLQMPERTRASVCATIMPALGWLSDSTAVEAASGGSFDVAELLASRGTVYLLGAEDGRTAPLVTALTGHIAREARRLAGFRPGGRLDPPLTLALDEAALICQVPLDQWSADMGGRGVTMHIAAQGRSQLIQRWGREGAASIINNSSSVLVYGGLKDTDDLEVFSKLTGERYEEVVTRDDTGYTRSVTPHKVPVLSPGQISQLPRGRVLVLSRGMPAAVGTAEKGWERHDVRAVARAALWAKLRGKVNNRAARWSSRAHDAAEAAQPAVRAARARVRHWRTGRRDAPQSVRNLHHNHVHAPDGHGQSGSGQNGGGSRDAVHTGSTSGSAGGRGGDR